MTEPIPLPPVAADVVAEAVESLTSRLRKKLDDAIPHYAAAPRTAPEGSIAIACGEDATVTLAPGPSGAVTQAEQARCTCLLAPRCLHRAAVLSACPLADPDQTPATEPAAEAPAVAADLPDVPARSDAQITAANAVWSAACAVLAAGIPGAGAVSQAELLRAAHSARLAGLHRAEAAALHVVRGLREARARHDGHRLADLVSALRELLLTSARIAAADPDPALVGVARRAYQPGGGLRVHGVCREPIISAAGYGGVVTHLLGDDGRWYSAADVKPGGPNRARAAGTAPVAIGPAALDHAQLSRGGLLINGATVSPEGRLGSGKGVRATPLPGLPWSDATAASGNALAALFARPLAESAASRLANPAGGDPDRGERERELVACDVVILAAQAGHVLACEFTCTPEPDSTPVLLRLKPADAHPDLPHTANLRQLGSRPGLHVRVLGRLDPDQAATLRPLAVGPVPGAEATLRLPEEWRGRADLGYDRIQGSHLPPPDAGPEPPLDRAPLDPLTDSPLWRCRRLVELAVAGGRRAVGESAALTPLRAAGFHTAADLAAGLVHEAARRSRDDFGRLEDPDPDGYARAWLAAAVHLSATERALVLASWTGTPRLAASNRG